MGAAKSFHSWLLGGGSLLEGAVFDLQHLGLQVSNTESCELGVVTSKRRDTDVLVKHCFKC